jgi:ribosome-binding factor A
MLHSQPKRNTPRPLKVGETIRQALSEMSIRGELLQKSLPSITFSEVRVSPDLKNATAFFMPLGGIGGEELLADLKENSAVIRYNLAKKINHMKFLPKVYFKLDESFEYAQKVNNLLKNVMKDEVSQ